MKVFKGQQIIVGFNADGTPIGCYEDVVRIDELREKLKHQIDRLVEDIEEAPAQFVFGMRAAALMLGHEFRDILGDDEPEQPDERPNEW